MSQRTRIPPLSPFEEQAGFTRALRTGNRIVCAGTVGVEEDGSVSPDAGKQADRCFAMIRSYIEELGGRMEDVVRVRMFATDIKDADAITAAFTGTLVAIAALYHPSWKVEIEAEAVVGDDR